MWLSTTRPSLSSPDTPRKRRSARKRTGGRGGSRRPGAMVRRDLRARRAVTRHFYSHGGTKLMEGKEVGSPARVGIREICLIRCSRNSDPILLPCASASLREKKQSVVGVSVRRCFGESVGQCFGCDARRRDRPRTQRRESAPTPARPIFLAPTGTPAPSHRGRTARAERGVSRSAPYFPFRVFRLFRGSPPKPVFR